MAISSTVAAGVAAVVALASLDAIRGGEDPPVGARAEAPSRAEIAGPFVPQPDALAGTLFFTDASCRLRALDLGRLTLGAPGPRTSCRLTVSPDGRYAVVNRRSPSGRRGLWLVRLGKAPSLERLLGSSRSSPAWSPDGRFLAVCTSLQSSLVLELSTGRRRFVEGCHPVYLADGSLVTRGSSNGTLAVFANGRVQLDLQDLEQAFPPTIDVESRPHVLGAAGAPDGSLLLALSRASEGKRVVVLGRWLDGRLSSAMPLPASALTSVGSYGLTIDVDPRGEEAALVRPERLSRPVTESLEALVELGSGRLESTLRHGSYIGAAWSPDGAWLALTTGREIEIFGLDRSSPTYVLPVRARAIAWSPAPR
jgi:dipeptidyl aminopeptidase/acylaminoacyl peptidase